MLRSLYALGLAVLATAASASDWPQFLGPNRNGSTTDGRLARNWPPEGPKLLWECKLGAGFASCVIDGGKVYILDRIHEKTAAGEAKPAQDILRCIDLQTGKEAWSLAYDAPYEPLSYPGSRGTPCVDDRFVFTLGGGGQVRCVDKTTHALIWSHSLLTDFSRAKSRAPHYGYSQAPLLYQQMLIVTALNDDTGLVACDKTTGKELWRSAPLGGNSSSFSSPLIARIGERDQILFLGNEGKHICTLYGLDPATGKILWSQGGWRCQAPVAEPVPLGDGRFFITGGYQANSAMIKVEPQAGGFAARLLFNASADGKSPERQAAANPPGAGFSSHMHTPILYQGCLYGNGSSVQAPKNGLVCLDLEGRTQWQTGNQPSFELGGFILVDDLLIGLDGKAGMLRLVEANPHAYKQLAEAKVLDQKGGEIWACMAFADGRLVVRDHAVMKCLDLRAAK